MSVDTQIDYTNLATIKAFCKSLVKLDVLVFNSQFINK